MYADKRTYLVPQYTTNFGSDTTSHWGCCDSSWLSACNHVSLRGPASLIEVLWKFLNIALGECWFLFREKDVLTSRLSASCLADKNCHAVVFDTVQEFLLYKMIIITLSVCPKSAMYQLCLNIGRRSLADWIETYAPRGAEETTLSSVSVARSSVLPGPTVPGFQNCRVDAMVGNVRLSLVWNVTSLETVKKLGGRYGTFGSTRCQFQRAYVLVGSLEER